jgi:YVTN family beta-propeller protein
MRRSTCFVIGLASLALAVGVAAASPFAYIPNAYSNNVSVIDTASNTVVATVPVGSYPVGVAVSASGARVYVANVDAASVSVIDAATNTVIATVPVGPNPSGVATDHEGKWIYVGSFKANNLSVIDATTNSVVATVPLESGPMGIVVDPTDRWVYATGPYANVVWVIDSANNAVAATVPAVPFAGGIALDATGALLYVTNIDANSLSVIDTLTRTVTAIVPVGAAPAGVAVNPAGSRVYVTNADANTVSVIDSGNFAVAATVRVGAYPVGVAVTPTGARVYVANGDSNSVSVIDSATNAVIATVRVGGSPLAIGQFMGPTSTPTPPAVNYQGLWWHAPAGSESGWGINVAHQDDVIFATWYTYDPTGKAWWLTMTAARSAESVYTGTLFQSNGPAFSAVPFDPNLVMRTAVGTGVLSFGDAENGTFAYTVNGVHQTKVITRQVFGPLPTCVWGVQQDLTIAANYQDLWWAAPPGSESGWGVNFTHQGNTIFATWFTYDFDGSPLWLSATAAKTGARIYSGQLIRTTGPAFDAQPFDTSAVTRAPVGTLTLDFADGNDARFAYTVALPGSVVVTQTKPITRQVFRAPGTVCRQAPP